MKSIKEKAEEHAPYTREDSWSKTQKCIIAQTSFEAGTNYVLEEILDKTSKCITIKDAYEAFLECVEQLKK